MQKVLITFFLSCCIISCNRNVLDKEKTLNLPLEIGSQQAKAESPPRPDDKKVHFPHGPHASAIECNTCHIGASRRPSIDQSLGHGFCLECHRQKHNGPTECSGCHK
ncbi:MAG: hypothetical protein AB7D06_15700 [Pedobacter sp.]